MNNQTVLITGGGTGIGLGIARCMLEAGAVKVILVGRREDVLQEACKELGEKSSYLSQDIAKLDEIPSFAQKVISDYGQPTCLVHNAGVNCKQPFLDLEDQKRLLRLAYSVVSFFKLA